MDAKEIDRLIQLFTQTADALSKTDFLTSDEQARLNTYYQYEEVFEQASILGVSCDREGDERRRIGYGKDVSAALKKKLLKAKEDYLKSTVKPLQKQLFLYLSPRLPQLKLYSEQKLLEGINNFLPEGILAKNYVSQSSIGAPASVLNTQKEKIITALECVKAKLEYQIAEKPKAEQKTGGGEAWGKERKGNVNVNIYGDVQAENLQIANDASIQEQPIAEEKKKGSIKKLLKIIATIIAFIAALLTSLYHLGWLEPIKAFIDKILWPK
jgi:hypothetical protein